MQTFVFYFCTSKHSANVSSMLLPLIIGLLSNGAIVRSCSASSTATSFMRIVITSCLSTDKSSKQLCNQSTVNYYIDLLC